MGVGKGVAGKLAVGGTVTGTVVLNGSTTSRMVARGDLTDVERGGVSHVTGTGSFKTGRGATIANSWFDVDARLHPLSLITVGRFLPGAGLRGSASGPIRLTGTTRNLAIRTNLAFPDGGNASLTGTLDLASKETGYDVSFNTELFNASSIMAKAPRTSLTINGTA